MCMGSNDQMWLLILSTIQSFVFPYFLLLVQWSELATCNVWSFPGTLSRPFLRMLSICCSDITVESWVVVQEAVRPRNPEIFTIWTFQKKFDEPCSGFDSSQYVSDTWLNGNSNEVELSIQFLSGTSRISNIQQPHVATDYWRCRYRIFPTWQQAFWTAVF